MFVVGDVIDGECIADFNSSKIPNVVSHNLSVFVLFPLEVDGETVVGIDFGSILIFGFAACLSAC